MLDAACPGQVFTSPTPDQMLAAAQAVDRGAGTLFIVKNYSGDIMNFEMAAEMYEGTSATVLTNDDVAVEDSTYTTGRRGVAGTLVVEKVVVAAAEAGADLETCRALGARVNERTASMGVALTSCTVPEAGRPTFDIDDDLPVPGSAGAWAPVYLRQTTKSSSTRLDTGAIEGGRDGEAAGYLGRSPSTVTRVITRRWPAKSSTA